MRRPFPPSFLTLGCPLCPESSSGWYGRTLILMVPGRKGSARLGQLAATVTLSGRGRGRGKASVLTFGTWVPLLGGGLSDSAVTDWQER